MKKRLFVLLTAGVLASAMMLGACAPKSNDGGETGGGGTEETPFVPETPDQTAPAYSDADATLSLTGAIDKTTQSNQISADLFGLFLEDINYASFALDDNLLINSSFENKQISELSGGQLYPWTASGGTMSVVTSGGVNESAAFAENNTNTGTTGASYVNKEHLKLTMSSANATLRNSGHPSVPMAVTEGTDYLFSAFIKGYTGKITLEIRNRSTVYATGEVNVSGTGWVKYQTTLTATASASSNVYFLMTFEKSGTVYLDNVTLETQDKNEATGIKTYLFNAIKDLSPKFFRFPGGCIIEGRYGTYSDEYYDWKNSIGAVAGTDGKDTVPAFTYTLNVDGKTSQVTTYGEQATRSYNTDIWSFSAYGGTNYYQMEYAIGYYEYFLLCEELGAKAIPILNCGLSCMPQDGGGNALRGRHGNGVQDFIQDAFDCIAFAKGDPNSSDANEVYWAQVRVNMGHPEPFDMDYIGIGNEQWGSYYSVYYEKFLEAFAKADNDLYRSVRPIVGNCTRFGHCENPKTSQKGVAQQAAETYTSAPNGANATIVSDYGVVDQHYYVNFTDMFCNHDMYDDYGRPDDDPIGYYEVFVGEYAANADVVSWKANGENVIIDTTKFGGAEAYSSSWINALSEAAMMTGYERNGDIVKLAAYAPMFANLNGVRQWPVDMMYYTNTALVLTPSYYVQQLFMKNSGDYKVASTLTFAGEKPTLTFTSTTGETRTVDQLYYVTSADEETGDVIIKIVNAGGEAVKLNISLAEMTGIRLSDIAEVHEVTGSSYTDVNTLLSGIVDEKVRAEDMYTIGTFTNGNTFGYEVKEYSVTAIRVRTH